jgi:hypothetical protein
VKFPAWLDLSRYSLPSDFKTVSHGCRHKYQNQIAPICFYLMTPKFLSIELIYGKSYVLIKIGKVFLKFTSSSGFFAPSNALTLIWTARSDCLILQVEKSALNHHPTSSFTSSCHNSFDLRSSPTIKDISANKAAPHCHFHRPLYFDSDDLTFMLDAAASLHRTRCDFSSVGSG